MAPTTINVRLMQRPYIIVMVWQEEITTAVRVSHCWCIDRWHPLVDSIGRMYWNVNGMYTVVKTIPICIPELLTINDMERRPTNYKNMFPLSTFICQFFFTSNLFTVCRATCNDIVEGKGRPNIYFQTSLPRNVGRMLVGLKPTYLRGYLSRYFFTGFSFPVITPVK